MCQVYTTFPVKAHCNARRQGDWGLVNSNRSSQDNRFLDVIQLLFCVQIRTEKTNGPNKLLFCVQIRTEKTNGPNDRLVWTQPYYSAIFFLL